MEVRCKGCNKLFRVSDDKLAESGIKFGCTKCGQTVKITKEDIEQYTLSKAAESTLSSFTPKAKTPKTEQVAPAASGSDHVLPADDRFSPDAHEHAAPKPAPAAVAVAAASPAVADSGSRKPASAAAVLDAPDQAHAAIKPSAVPKPVSPSAAEPVRSSSDVKTRPAPAVESRPPRPPVKPSVAAAPASREFAPVAARRSGSGLGRMITIIVVVLLVIGGAAVGIRMFLMQSAQKASQAAAQITSPEGLQILNASGTVDPVKGDLVITGAVQNSTDQPKPAWYVLIDVYDAQGTVLTRGRLISGKQLYTPRDFDLLAKRGENIQDLKMKSLQQGVIIPPHGSVNFEVRILEPPVGVASFNASLQPFDPVQMFKELSQEQK